jgi:hypothetical protein
MRVHLVFFIYLVATVGTAQTENGRVIPKITSLPIEEGEVTLIHLVPGYTTSVRFPEEVRSVVLGNPGSFKAEHSEAEPRMVFLKPITSEPSESNALVTTKSGQQISLQLVSAGKGVIDARVDFVVEYHQRRSMVIDPETQSSVIAEIRPPATIGPPSSDSPKPDPLARELTRQRSLPSPEWRGKEILATTGASVDEHHQTILGFSVLNSSKRVVELLPPQLELSSNDHGKSSKRTKAEPVAVAEYRLTTRRLAPGQRADGVVVFERPAFKESSEQLQLQLAEAERVDRPILLPVPFTATSVGGTQ